LLHATLQAVAKLTADNLVFLMNLKKAEADLAAAHQVCDLLQAAALLLPYSRKANHQAL
jgi:hypothetical protein